MLCCGILLKTFFFWSSPTVILDRKIGLILGEIIFILIFVLLDFSEVPAPPPFQNLAYATVDSAIDLKPIYAKQEQ